MARSGATAVTGESTSARRTSPERSEKKALPLPERSENQTSPERSEKKLSRAQREFFGRKGRPTSERSERTPLRARCRTRESQQRHRHSFE